MVDKKNVRLFTTASYCDYTDFFLQNERHSRHKFSGRPPFNVTIRTNVTSIACSAAFIASSASAAAVTAAVTAALTASFFTNEALDFCTKTSLMGCGVLHHSSIHASLSFSHSSQNKGSLAPQYGQTSSK